MFPDWARWILFISAGGKRMLQSLARWHAQLAWVGGYSCLGAGLPVTCVWQYLVSGQGDLLGDCGLNKTGRESFGAQRLVGRTARLAQVLKSWGQQNKMNATEGVTFRPGLDQLCFPSSILIALDETLAGGTPGCPNCVAHISIFFLFLGGGGGGLENIS